MADKAANAYRTISEAGAETGLPAHVLRFWESKFSQLRPVKRAGGRRLYRPQDISIILGLKHLLYEEGFTIKGAQKYVKDHGVAHLIEQIERGQSPSVLDPAVAQAVEAAPASEVSEAPLFDRGPIRSPVGAMPLSRLDRAIQRLSEAKTALASVRKPT